MSAMAPVLDAARDLCAAHPELAAYAPWPAELTPANIPAAPIPATAQVADFPLPGSDLTGPLTQAICATAQHAGWKTTYREDEVGADFLARFGYYELFGRTGHFHCTSLRGYIAYWGAALNYDWHNHEAEELYLCLAGTAEFHREDGTATLAPGDTRAHKSWEAHAMTTKDQPILTFVLWRGAGLSGLPQMR